MIPKDAVQDRLMTEDDLLRISADDAHRYELIEGRLVVREPPGHFHGYVAAEVLASLRNHVKKNGLGRTYAAETGFTLRKNPDTVRAPDAAFVRKERLTPDIRKRGYFPGPPDLAVEVVSPGESVREVEEKALHWVDAGTLLVIVIDPEREKASVYSPDGVRHLQKDDSIDGGEVVPGWQLSLRELFDELQ